MTESRTMMASPYMEWAKTRSQARFCLATSGIANVPMAEFPARLEDLEITSPDGYGYEELRRRLAARAGVSEDCVVQANGTSMANHLAMTACFEPGDEVLIEQPTYELLTSTARALGARIRRFVRRFEEGFRVDPAEVKRQITPATRLVVLTNLHNPSGVLIDGGTLREVGEMARNSGARVLVDEVYLDMAFSRSPRSSFLLDPKTFVVTSSLTKVYGLSGLRCGWILAEPELARRMWRLRDLMDASISHLTERMSVIALDHLEQFARRARHLLQTNRPLLDNFLNSRKDLSAVRPEFGTLVFPRLLCDDADGFFAFLREKFETTVVPGRFFEMPQHFRLGIGGDTKTVETGLEQLGAALQEWSDRPNAASIL
jgi:aspartate/methionine/tyrosine aminotransferase